uniref:Uncharacterized protein n=1 Tax=Aegilops tauschii subsp. strangulata TaxID=200361 RepID=A0A453M9T8_AEGTS
HGDGGTPRRLHPSKGGPREPSEQQLQARQHTTLSTPSNPPLSPPRRIPTPP